jgi:hypothetical protein
MGEVPMISRRSWFGVILSAVSAVVVVAVVVLGHGATRQQSTSLVHAITENRNGITFTLGVGESAVELGNVGITLFSVADENASILANPCASERCLGNLYPSHPIQLVLIPDKPQILWSTIRITLTASTKHTATFTIEQVVK